MGILCRDDRPYMISSSNIGSISKCSCCNSYHVAIGNITLRMERKHLLSLTQMIIEGLEEQSVYEEEFDRKNIQNYA